LIPGLIPIWSASTQIVINSILHCKAMRNVYRGTNTLFRCCQHMLQATKKAGVEASQTTSRGLERTRQSLFFFANKRTWKKQTQSCADRWNPSVRKRVCEKSKSVQILPQTRDAPGAQNAKRRTLFCAAHKFLKGTTKVMRPQRSFFRRRRNTQTDHTHTKKGK